MLSLSLIYYYYYQSILDKLSVCYSLVGMSKLCQFILPIMIWFLALLQIMLNHATYLCHKLRQFMRHEQKNSIINSTIIDSR